MVIVSHDIKIIAKCRLCMLCGRGGGIMQTESFSGG